MVCLISSTEEHPGDVVRYAIQLAQGMKQTSGMRLHPVQLHWIGIPGIFLDVARQRRNGSVGWFYRGNFMICKGLGAGSGNSQYISRLTDIRWIDRNPYVARLNTPQMVWSTTGAGEERGH